MTTLKTMFENVWNFIKSKWLWIVGIILGIFAIKKLTEPKQSPVAIVTHAGQITTTATIAAEEKEKASVENVTIVATVKQEARDILITTLKERTDSQINQRVEEAIEKDVEDPDKLADDIANEFGGKNVKNSKS